MNLHFIAASLRAAATASMCAIKHIGGTLPPIFRINAEQQGAAGYGQKEREVAMENEVVWDARAIIFTVSYIAMMGLLLIAAHFHSGQMIVA